MIYPPSITKSVETTIESLLIKWTHLRVVHTTSITLLLIALLSTAALLLGSHMLLLNESSHTVINISSKQRMLSQRAGRYALDQKVRLFVENINLLISKGDVGPIPSTDYPHY